MREKLIQGHRHVEIEVRNFEKSIMIERSAKYYKEMHCRRSIRNFSDKTVPKEVIESIILTANSAPSGAHKQPWTFCAISNQSLKQKIREAAEAEEKINYESRMSDRWKKDLEIFATNWEKDFLTIAPWLIVVFKQSYGLSKNGEKENHYYVNESVGIACGFLISAIHQAGLVTLTHTPSPMNFLTNLLNRPENERPFLLLPVGYAAKPCFVPDIKRKTIDQVAVFYE